MFHQSPTLQFTHQLRIKAVLKVLSIIFSLSRRENEFSIGEQPVVPKKRKAMAHTFVQQGCWTEDIFKSAGEV